MRLKIRRIFQIEEILSFLLALAFQESSTQTKITPLPSGHYAYSVDGHKTTSRTDTICVLNRFLIALAIKNFCKQKR